MSNPVVAMAVGESVKQTDDCSSGPHHRVMTDRGRWHPGIRLVLFLLVLIPSIAVVVLAGSEAISAWRSREHARTASSDAAVLSKVAAARAQFNSLEVPMTAVSYAAQLGVNESALDTLLKPSVPFDVQLEDESENLAQSPVFAATPTLRKDLAAAVALIPEIQARSVTFTEVHSLPHQDGRRHRRTVVPGFQPPSRRHCILGSSWRFRGSRGQLSTRHIRRFWPVVTRSRAASMSSKGIGPADSKQELIQAAGEFHSATNEFAGPPHPIRPASVEFASRPTRVTRSSPQPSHVGSTLPFTIFRHPLLAT